MLFFPAAKSGTRPPFPCSRLIGPALVLGSLVSLAGCAGGTMVGSGGFTRSATPIAEYETADASASANLASLTDVVQRNPSDAGALNTRGAAYARIGRYQEAIADFNAALKIEPNMATALTNRALANRQIGRLRGQLPPRLERVVRVQVRGHRRVGGNIGQRDGGLERRARRRRGDGEAAATAADSAAAAFDDDRAGRRRRGEGDCRALPGEDGEWASPGDLAALSELELGAEDLGLAGDELCFGLVVV